MRTVSAASVAMEEPPTKLALHDTPWHEELHKMTYLCIFCIFGFFVIRLDMRKEEQHLVSLGDGTTSNRKMPAAVKDQDKTEENKL
ncbi:hypothetical protein chiPu_0006654 [Chiloscyllium punctatum]|uniref:Uncharacterized protein n=1 Tax=Chiloscyllium punctatum TaxID=137246 RepID=A0A401SCV4_CHIPU|nr:hypothetical protein [Chiloscyllium punctatum]